MYKKTVLERFKDIKELEVADDLGTVADVLPYFCKNVDEALLRLEGIDNANPSEALESLEHIKKDDFNMIITTYPPITAYNGITKDEMFNKIEQSLIKAQKMEKVLKILKEKRVNVDLFWNDFVDNGFCYHCYLEKWYKYQSTDSKQLTQEEFNLVKEMLKDE